MKTNQNNYQKLWLAIGFSQIFIVSVIYFFVYKYVEVNATVQDEATIPLVICSCFAVILGMVGHIYYKKALVIQDQEKQRVFFLLSWFLAEAITLLGVIGLVSLWHEIQNSLSFWFSGFVLWVIRYPKIEKKRSMST